MMQYETMELLMWAWLK